MKFRINYLSALIVVFLISASFVSAKELKILHEKNYNVKSGSELNINTTVGDLYLSTWDKEEISVKISGNRKAEEKINFSFNAGNGGLEIDARKESSSWFSFSGVYLKYEIKVPKNFNAYIKTAGGDIKFYDLNGRSELKTSGGNIKIFNFSGETGLYTSGGDIEINNSKGIIESETSGGNIDILSFNGNILTKTSGGDIEIQSSNGKINASTSGGDIKLNYKGENRGIDLHTSGGDILVELQNDLKADIDLHTSGGEVECDLNMTRTLKVKSNIITAEVNGGGEKIICKTSGGNIKVRNFSESAQK